MNEDTRFYNPKILRVDLTTGKITTEYFKDDTIPRKYIGGVGLGTKILYDEVPPEVGSLDPENKIVWALGPFTGTSVAGSGLACVVTKSSLTEGLLSAQTLGQWGAKLRHAGYEILIVQGAGECWQYLYITRDKVELRSAKHLLGLDTMDTEDAIKTELGCSECNCSVACIGPAGEHLVRFAGIFNDKGHVTASGGPGAIMGSKKLKAIAIEASINMDNIPVADPVNYMKYKKEAKAAAEESPAAQLTKRVGTLGSLNFMNSAGLLPVKNYTEKSFPTCAEFDGSSVKKDDTFSFVRRPCWACAFNHCHSVKITKGKYKGMTGDEPEYEGMSAMSALIGNMNDTAGSIMLNITIDRLGMDVKEGGFLLAMAIECYEKGIITKKDTDGLELTWGNCDAVAALLHKIAYREGCGNLFAEGVMRAAHKLGNGAEKCAVYFKQGYAPHIHDQRMQWGRIMGFGLSDYGSNMVGPVEHFIDPDLGLNKSARAFSTDEIPVNFAKGVPHRIVDDGMGLCLFYTQIDLKIILKLLNALTGWDMDMEEFIKFGHRVSTLMHCFNLRHGWRVDDYGASARLEEAPQEPYPTVSCKGQFKTLAENYYKALDWDIKTSCPSPDRLKYLDMTEVIKDMDKIDWSIRRRI